MQSCIVDKHTSKTLMLRERKHFLKYLFFCFICIVIPFIFLILKSYVSIKKFEYSYVEIQFKPNKSTCIFFKLLDLKNFNTMRSIT